jgi:hypothetical protein
MFGLDEHIASLSNGTTFLLVAAVAAVLGLRHATDPDHLAAVSTFAASDGTGRRHARDLGFAWGAGHATTLFAFGVPIVAAHAYLPDGAQRAAELAVGVLIMALAGRLILRWRRGELAHGHDHGRRTPRAAYGIGLLHGIGGSAGVGVLMLAGIPDHATAVVALAIFAAGSAVAMGVASAGLGTALGRAGTLTVSVAPAFGMLSLAFGAWYALGAVEAVPYLL